MKVHNPLDQLRCSYRPDTIRVLFIGESPPAGGTFFYQADSNLARYTQEVFSTVFDTVFESGEDFLRVYQNLGCYLDDLCLIPVNKLGRVDRECQRTRSVDSLAIRIRSASPQAIVVVMRAITPHVERAVERANIGRVAVYSVPFPALGHQRRYVTQLVGVLRKLQQADLLLCVLPQPRIRTMPP